MKKLATLLALILAGASSVMAQGFLAAANNTANPLTAYNATGGPGGTPASNVVGQAGSLLPQGSVYVSLWVATNGAPTSALQQVAIGTNSASSFPGALGTFNLGNPLTLNAPWDGSFQVELLYRAWSLSLGNTWNNAWLTAAPVGAYAGQSALLQNFSLGTGASAPPATFGAGLLNGLVLVGGTIPEPSTIVLAGLGLASLLAIRRRK